MDILSPFQIALSLLVSFEPELMGIIGLSLGVSLTAVGISLVIGLPLGALLAAYRFPGRGAIIVSSNTMPSATASANSPIDVAWAIDVVITRVEWRILPPTIITAPTSEMARPKQARPIVIRDMRASLTRLAIHLN